MLFGYVGTDDYSPEIICHIVLASGKVGWSANISGFWGTYEDTDYSNLKQKIKELVEEINNAIRSCQIFDFMDYIKRWKLFDNNFVIFVSQENHR